MMNKQKTLETMKKMSTSDEPEQKASYSSLILFLRLDMSLKNLAKTPLIRQSSLTILSLVSDDLIKIGINKMRSRIFDLLLKVLTLITVFLLITACMGGELSEIEAFFKFIRAVDPENLLGISWNGTVPHPCSNKWKGVNCNLQATTITEIRLQNLNLSGMIDADSVCKLQNLQVLSLARNLIQGSIPHSISNCKRLTYLDLSSNLLSGKVTMALTKLKHLQTVNISNNPNNYSLKGSAIQIYNLRKLLKAVNSEAMIDSATNSQELPLQSPTDSESDSSQNEQLLDLLPYILGIVFFILFLLVVYFVIAKINRAAKEREILKSLAHSPQKNSPPAPIEEVLKPAEGESPELVFFVEEQETFKLDDLFEATADLQSQTLYSSLYKVILKNNVVYAVKRLKKLHMTFTEFGKTMRQIGNLKHPNILPLVGYNSTSEEKLLIYKYQSNGNLLNLLEDHIEGRKVFPWKLRLSIASGIAKGLDFIYQNSHNPEIIPHGNLKSANILLDENEEPLISEYGFTKFLDPMKAPLFSSNGYTAPERALSEQGDVYSYGIILLELLTGKTVEKSGIDLPKWVRSMVREEWTGEVFDKEVSNAAREYAFPFLNIALKCVSYSPGDRPTMAEVMEKIEEMVNVHDDISISSMASIESSPQDCCLLHTVIPETWDTPGSNY